MSAPKLWRTLFQRAVDVRSEDRFADLLRQAQETPSLVTIDSQPQSPLTVAIRLPNAWAVGQGLKQGLPVTPLDLAHFFTAMCINSERPKPSDELLRQIWPQLLPAVEASARGRSLALRRFLEHMSGHPETSREQWDALGMDRLCQGVADVPGLVFDYGASLSPLQQAWLSGRPVAVDRLISAGASVTQAYPDTALPDWTLASAMAERETALKGGWSDSAMAAFAPIRWAAQNDALRQELGRSFAHFCDPFSEPDWRPALAAAKAQALESGLPAAKPRSKGPRF